ncbi:MAG: hypothetical protein COA67_10970 [Lutibacter sp.]|nr:MAG: hypothetical protein COA67_10970 [Lutibacter sp.]
MTLELIIFIAAVLFGIILYWRESSGNGVYRFFNKLMNSKELQMKPFDKKGFVYQQSFLLRLVFISALFLVAIVVTQFLIPISLATISIFASMIVGTLVGTYIAGMIFKSSEVIDEKSDSLEDLVHDTIEKGKDFIEDLQHKNDNTVTSSAVEKKENIIKEEKSARERLKDKGLL